MPTKIIILKLAKYSCFHICCVDDAKVVDWIFPWSKLIFQPGSNKHNTEMGNQKHTAQRQKIKIDKDVVYDKIIKTNERNLKICENYLFN